MTYQPGPTAVKRVRTGGVVCATAGIVAVVAAPLTGSPGLCVIAGLAAVCFGVLIAAVGEVLRRLLLLELLWSQSTRLLTALAGKVSQTTPAYETRRSTRPAPHWRPRLAADDEHN